MAEPYINVPGHPGLRVECRNDRDGEGRVVLAYTGEHQQLVAAGIIPATSLVRWVRGTPRGKVDCDGERVNVELYFGTAGGVPVPRARVILRKSLDRGLQLPGAELALQAFQRARAASAEFEERKREYNAQRAIRESWAATAASKANGGFDDCMLQPSARLLH